MNLFVSVNIKYHFSCFRRDLKFLRGSLWDVFSSSHIQEVMVDYPQGFACCTETRLQVSSCKGEAAHGADMWRCTRGRAVGSAGVAGNGGEVLVLAQRGRRAHAACSHSSITVTGGCTGWAPGDARPDILHVPQVFNFSCCVSCFSSPWREKRRRKLAGTPKNRARSASDGIQTVIVSSLKQHGQKNPQL